MCKTTCIDYNIYDEEQKVFDHNNLIYTKNGRNALKERIIATLALPGDGTCCSILFPRQDIQSGSTKANLAKS